MSARIDEWTPEMATAVRGLMVANPILKVAVEVLASEHPTSKAVLAQATSPQLQDFAYAYGIEVGYQRCLATLNSLIYPKAPPKDPVVSEFAEEKDES